MAQMVVWDGYKQVLLNETEVSDGWDDVKDPAVLITEAFADTPWMAVFQSTGTNNNLLSFTYQMQHSWDMKTPVKPHMHVIPMVAPPADRVVRMTGAWAWSQVNAVTPLNVGWTTFTVDRTITAADAMRELIIPLATVPPLAVPATSDILLLWVQRLGLNAADTYNTVKTPGTATANLAVISVDCHYFKSRNGSVGEFA
jgi:hypothetical protein